MLNNKCKKEIEMTTIERYTKRYNDLGVGHKTLGWGSVDDQIVRFERMTRFFKLDGMTVMDIGCGFADFYKYLLDNDVQCNYIGVDINEKFIESNRKMYPEAEFLVANIMTNDVELPNADIIVANGVLNFKLSNGDNLEYTQEFVEKLFNKCHKGVCVDFLSTFLTESYPKESFVYYHNPVTLLEFAFDLTPNACILHDYRPIPQKEFMLILEK